MKKKDLCGYRPPTIAIPSPQDNKQEREKIRQELEGEFSEREKKAVAAAEKELKSVRKECRELQAKAESWKSS